VGQITVAPHERVLINQLRAYKMKTGLFWHEISDQMGVSYYQMKKWIRGVYYPTGENMRKIQSVLKGGEQMEEQLTMPGMPQVEEPRVKRPYKKRRGWSKKAREAQSIRVHERWRQKQSNDSVSFSMQNGHIYVNVDSMIVDIDKENKTVQLKSTGGSLDARV